MTRDIEEDRRMAAFLQSKDYKDESWMTEEIQYTKWVEAGRPVYYEPFKIKGFNKRTEEDKL